MRINFFRRPHQFLTVLMYHKVAADHTKDFLTVSCNDLEEQFSYLRQEGYTSILLSDLVAFVQQQKPLPERPVLLTFDDGYQDNYEVMYPLLLKYDLKAAIFLVPSFLNREGYLSKAALQAMDPRHVEFGLHSFDHKSYKKLSLEELAEDIVLTKNALYTQGIVFQPCLAYPYGAYPKRNIFKRRRFLEVLQHRGIAVAFRIGNRLNPLPLSQPLIVQRLDVRGDESLEKFRKKLG